MKVRTPTGPLVMLTVRQANYDGDVRFLCECGKSGPSVPQGLGAAIQACQQWNRMTEAMR